MVATCNCNRKQNKTNLLKIDKKRECLQTILQIVEGKISAQTYQQRTLCRSKKSKQWKISRNYNRL